MRAAIYLLVVLLVFGASLGELRCSPTRTGPAKRAGAGSGRPELEYLKAVNSVAPPRDPQLLFLLMAEYSNSNRQGEGAEVFSARLKEFGPRLTDIQKALYLSCHRVVAGSARIFRLVVVPNRLHERHDRNPRSSQAAFWRASLRSELDCRRRPYRTSKHLSSKEGSAG